MHDLLAAVVRAPPVAILALNVILVHQHILPLYIVPLEIQGPVAPIRPMT